MSTLPPFEKHQIYSSMNLIEEFIDINEQSGCDEKDDDPEEVMPGKKKSQHFKKIGRNCWRGFKTRKCQDIM